MPSATLFGHVRKSAVWIHWVSRAVAPGFIVKGYKFRSVLPSPKTLAVHRGVRKAPMRMGGIIDEGSRRDELAFRIQCVFANRTGYAL